MKYLIGLGLIMIGCLPSAYESGLVWEICGGVISIAGVLYFLSDVVDKWNRA